MLTCVLLSHSMTTRRVAHFAVQALTTELTATKSALAAAQQAIADLTQDLAGSCGGACVSGSFPQRAPKTSSTSVRNAQTRAFLWAGSRMLAHLSGRAQLAATSLKRAPPLPTWCAALAKRARRLVWKKTRLNALNAPQSAQRITL